MSQTKRNYKATFILDNRGKEDSVESIIDGVKKEISAVHGEVTAVENIGRREFARKTDDKFPAGVYVQVAFSAPSAAPAQLHERLRLNTSVYRTLVENA
ncbi:MAG TPA: 30S ribosomal protein S6 [Lacunisphaera sp.]|nr:30S ribosomal protein S6 [Lacunisphaera sp.]